MKDVDAKEFYELKMAVVNILNMTLAGHNGGYSSEFGPATLATLLRITRFDMKNRKILKEQKK